MKIFLTERTPVTAELYVEGIGAILVNADKRIIEPKAIESSLILLDFAEVPLQALKVVRVMDSIEETASSLFPDFEDCGFGWLWHVQNCNECRCFNCLN